MKIICGLGNPGREYQNTPHNAGFLVVDEIARECGVSFQTGSLSKFNALTAECRFPAGVAGEKVLLVKPHLFMNRSGGPLKQVASYFKVELSDIVIVHDDIDLRFGEIKLKFGGGEGGHNGLRSISSSFGSKDYLRVRVGVGRGEHPEGDGQVGTKTAAKMVLKGFSGRRLDEFLGVIDRAKDATESLLTDGLLVAQRKFHAKG